MTDPRTDARRWLPGLLLLLGIAGCGKSDSMAEVFGTVRINGEVPPVGASITFFPADGKSATSGCLIQDGKYRTRVALGTSKVEIRAPRKAKAATRPGPKVDGPGHEPGQARADAVEEWLPPEYHDRSKLMLDVPASGVEKHWEIDLGKK